MLLEAIRLLPNIIYNLFVFNKDFQFNIALWRAHNIDEY